MIYNTPLIYKSFPLDKKKTYVKAISNARSFIQINITPPPNVKEMSPQKSSTETHTLYTSSPQTAHAVSAKLPRPSSRSYIIRIPTAPRQISSAHQKIPAHPCPEFTRPLSLSLSSSDIPRTRFSGSPTRELLAPPIEAILWRSSGGSVITRRVTPIRPNSPDN